MTNDDSSTSVVRRLAAVLDAFGAGDAYLGVNEIARRTQLPKSTVSRLVKEMQEAGFLERKAEKVGLGLQMFEWGERATRRRSVREVALPFMADLREATRQTIHLAVLDGTEVVYVEILHREDAPRLPSKVGGRLPAHATGVGKALLSASEPAVIEQAIAAGLVAVGPRTIRNADVLGSRSGVPGPMALPTNMKSPVPESSASPAPCSIPKAFPWPRFRHRAGPERSTSAGWGLPCTLPL